VIFLALAFAGDRFSQFGVELGDGHFGIEHEALPTNSRQL
jgi:hypothetical protein